MAKLSGCTSAKASACAPPLPEPTISATLSRIMPPSRSPAGATSNPASALRSGGRGICWRTPAPSAPWRWEFAAAWHRRRWASRRWELSPGRSDARAAAPPRQAGSTTAGAPRRRHLRRRLDRRALIGDDDRGWSLRLRLARLRRRRRGGEDLLRFFGDRASRRIGLRDHGVAGPTERPPGAAPCCHPCARWP